MKISIRVIEALVALFFVPLIALGQVQTLGTVNYVYSEKINSSVNVEPLGEGLFGDQTSMEDGSTVFRAIDVAIPAEVNLPFQIGRVLNVEPSRGWRATYDQTPDIFGYKWRADIPYIEGDFIESYGWVASTVGTGERCSSGNFSLSAINISQIIIKAHNFFFGNTINIPGSGREKMLAIPVGGPRPQDGATYVGTTRSNWKVSCLTSIKNGSGEGFQVVLPDGAKYFFDWIASERTGYIMTARGTVYTNRMRLYATRAEDRFGRSVEYNFDSGNPHRIVSVRSGLQSIDIFYTNEGRVSYIQSSGRRWDYSYINGALAVVSLPDGSSWKYGNPPTGVDSNPWFQPCTFSLGSRTSSSVPASDELRTYEMTHPSGAVGIFKFRSLMFGYNRTPGICQEGGDYIPVTRIALSLYEKTISGPGISPISWSMKYYPSWSYEDQCQGCPTTASTVVSRSDSVVTTYVFGNDYSTNAGQLLSRSTAGSGGVKITRYKYANSAAGYPFPDVIGEDKYQILSNPIFLKNRPVIEESIELDGYNYRASYVRFDQYARPVEIVKTGSPMP